jgi:hypothetical protein
VVKVLTGISPPWAIPAALKHCEKMPKLSALSWPKLIHATTKSPFGSIATDGKLWAPMVIVLTRNSLP